MPIPDSPLRYVLSYVFETDHGIFLVDPGWDTDEGYEILGAGLATAGAAVTEVRGVLVTHLHSDHYGLAGRIRAASGAWIALHRGDAALIASRHYEPADVLTRVARLLRRGGVPDDETWALLDTATTRLPVNLVEPDVIIEDGDRMAVPGWELRAIWTPGHSPGHVSFYEAKHKVMLSGDHVLPRITPSIPYPSEASSDTLGAYLAALTTVAAYDVSEVLPAHEYRFTTLTSRAADIAEHHEARAREVLALIGAGAHTAWDIATGITWRRPWRETEARMKRIALGETLAHLRALEVNGLVREVAGEPSRWLLAPRRDPVELAVQPTRPPEP